MSRGEFYHTSARLARAFFYANKESSMDTITAFFAKLSAPFEWVVQKVRDYPKGFLILAGVLIAVAWFA